MLHLYPQSVLKNTPSCSQSLRHFQKNCIYYQIEPLKYAFNAFDNLLLVCHNKIFFIFIMQIESARLTPLASQISLTDISL